MPDETPLTIDLSGPRWHARLVVKPPDATSWVMKSFEVPAGDALRRVDAWVCYTEAENQPPERQPPDFDLPEPQLSEQLRRWHVKIYRCGNPGDAEDLRGYLFDQAREVQLANGRVPKRSRIPIEPPWAVVPVHIVRGDGVREHMAGDVYTGLGAPAEQIVGRLQASLPSWLVQDPPAPDLYLLAISPFLYQMNWESSRGVPHTEQIEEFRPMAVGLDAMHRNGTVHCDIKPANVCRFSTTKSVGYVLIDADAVTRTSPAPRTLRTAQLYEHGDVRRWRASNTPDGRLAIDPGALRAQDRFGFALVVLVALAGRDWVESQLLSVRPGGATRRADRGGEVAEALADHWPDTEDRAWAPLIDTLAEPFDADLAESGAWAEPWIDRVKAAVAQCAHTPDVAFRRGPRSSGRSGRQADLDFILVESRRGPKTRAGLVWTAHQVLARRAAAIAVRSAVRAGLALGGGLLAVAVILVVGMAGGK